jgi:prolyl-tRNA editing enzyme YbaK/EbsC (Cys-tRNA(Pro) deacylase)
MEQSTRTAEDAARACGCEVAQIVKSLIFEDGASGKLVLVLVSGRHNADTDFIGSTYGLELKRCDARRVRDETGFAIGGVAPIGHLSQPAVNMDSLLLTFPTVWCAAGRPDSVFSVTPSELRDAVHAAIIDVRNPM